MLLYIKNLPPDATKNHIRALFADLELEDVFQEEDCAFLRFASSIDLLRAVKKGAKNLMGRDLGAELIEDGDLLPTLLKIREGKEAMHRPPVSTQVAPASMHRPLESMQRPTASRQRSPVSRQRSPVSRQRSPVSRQRSPASRQRSPASRPYLPPTSNYDYSDGASHRDQGSNNAGFSATSFSMPSKRAIDDRDELPSKRYRTWEPSTERFLQPSLHPQTEPDDNYRQRREDKVRMSEHDPFAPQNRFGRLDHEEPSGHVSYPWSKDGRGEDERRRRSPSPESHSPPSNSQPRPASVTWPSSEHQPDPGFRHSPSVPDQRYAPDAEQNTLSPMYSNAQHPQSGFVNPAVFPPGRGFPGPRPAFMRPPHHRGMPRPGYPPFARGRFPGPMPRPSVGRGMPPRPRMPGYGAGPWAGPGSKMKPDEFISTTKKEKVIATAILFKDDVPKETFLEILKTWIMNNRKFIHVKNSQPIVKDYVEEGLRHCEVTFNFTGHRYPCFPPLTKMKDHVVTFNHYSQSRSCPVCHYQSHSPEMCNGLRHKKDSKGKICIHSGSPFPLSPDANLPFVYEDVEHNTICNAIRYLEKKALEGKVSDLIRYHWCNQQVETFRSLYKAQMAAHSEVKDALAEAQDITLVYISDDLALGSGIVPGFDIAAIRAAYQPGLNIIGYALTKLRLELRNTDDAFLKKFDLAQNRYASKKPYFPPGKNTGSYVRQRPPNQPHPPGLKPVPGQPPRSTQTTIVRQQQVHGVQPIKFDGILVDDDAEEFKKDVFEWMRVKLPHAVIRSDPDCHTEVDRQGAVHHVVTMGVEVPMVPCAPSFAVINKVACIITSQSREGFCRCCSGRHTKSDHCPAILTVKSPDVYFIGKKTEGEGDMLTPHYPMECYYECQAYSSIGQALVSLQELDFRCDYSEIDSHKRQTWILRAYDVIKEMYRSQLDVSEEMRHQLVISTDDKKIVFINHNKVLGSGLLKVAEMHYIKDEYYPGANMIGKILMELRQEYERKPLTQFHGVDFEVVDEI